MRTPSRPRRAKLALFVSIVAVAAGMSLFGAVSAFASSQGPIAAYSADAGEGEILEDITGNGHEGTIEGAAWTTRGKYGGALEFNGGNDCVSIPNTEGLQLSEEFTLEAWVRPSGQDKFTPIFFKEREGFYSYSLFLGAFESGHLEGFVANESPGWSEVTSGEALPAKAWSHIAFTDDGAHLRLYVNGELLDTSSAREVEESEGPLYLGCWPSEGEHFDGRIDEVRVYDRALGQHEIEPDLDPPSAPANFEAMWEAEPEAEEGEEKSTYITWSPSFDPNLPDGQLGSGVSHYDFQYKLPGDTSWSPVETIDIAAISIEAAEGDKIKLKVSAVDNAGNWSPVVFRTIIATPGEWTPEDIGGEFSNETGKASLDPESKPPYEEMEEPPAFGPNALDSFEETLCGSELVCGTYYGRSAARYAIKWNLLHTDNEEARERHDPHYGYYGGLGGDCTNFASAAVKAGGMRFMRSHGINTTDARDILVRAEFMKGQGSWWSYFYNRNSGPFPVRNYEATESWAHSAILRRHLLEYGLARPLGPSEKIRPGDLVFYNLTGLDLEDADHTQIVTGVGQRGIAVSQHSPGYRHSLARVIRENNTHNHRLNVDWTLQIIRPIHIVANIEE